MTMCSYVGGIRLFIILCTSICIQDVQGIRKPPRIVKRCPFNESEWKERAANMTCTEPETYHCLLIEGRPALGEQCVGKSLIINGRCPIFSMGGYLDWANCSDTACPSSSYLSNEVHKYQICYRKTYKSIEENTEQRSNDSGSVTGVTITIVVIVLHILVALVVVLAVFYNRNQFGFRDLINGFQHTDRMEDTTDIENGCVQSQEDPLLKIVKDMDDVRKKDESDIQDETTQKRKKLEELLKYLSHILKQELGVTDLKEKAVIHSKSINEHFSEPLIKDLQSLKDINDYSRFDTSLVFTFLRNFCEGIKAPSRGWDYEPPDDETHVAADIERIRSMWNKHCDNDVQFKYIDDVYNRIKRRYGTIGVLGDDDVEKSPNKDEKYTEGFDIAVNKIESIRLNPDCIVENGIVVTENITKALKILKSRNVVILKGAIGCGKTHALKAIQNHFKGLDYDTMLVTSENIPEEIAKEKPKILLCDNLFGRFGSGVFSQNEVNRTEEVLKTIANYEGSTKVAIGIHTHVYDEVKKNLNLSFLQQKNITVEMDNLSEAETLLIFKEQLKEGHCRRDSNCWFRSVGFQSVLDKISKNQGHIGGPFLSLMYCNQHELFSDEAFSVSPVKTLVQHFQRTKLGSTLYDCLVYLICVQQHNFEEEPHNWAGQISVEITKHNLLDLAKTSDLFRVENKRVTLAHELLTTALFKSVAEEFNIFLPVLQRCDGDVFTQLLRPRDTSCDLYYELSRDSRDEKKMCAYRLARRFYKAEISHPLMTIELVQNKYCEYLTRDPHFSR